MIKSMKIRVQCFDKKNCYFLASQFHEKGFSQVVFRGEELHRTISPPCQTMAVNCQHRPFQRFDLLRGIGENWELIFGLLANCRQSSLWVVLYHLHNDRCNFNTAHCHPSDAQDNPVANIVGTSGRINNSSLCQECLLKTKRVWSPPDPIQADGQTLSFLESQQGVPKKF